MINYKNHQAVNFHTAGYEGLLEGSTLKIAAGSFHLCDEDKRIQTPDFSFDIEADDVVGTVYDVYILDAPEAESQAYIPIHIDRTELEEDVFPGYTGDGKVLYTLMSFFVPPGTTDFSSLDITINTVVKSDEA